MSLKGHIWEANQNTASGWTDPVFKPVLSLRENLCSRHPTCPLTYVPGSRTAGQLTSLRTSVFCGGCHILPSSQIFPDFHFFSHFLLFLSRFWLTVYVLLLSHSQTASRSCSPYSDLVFWQRWIIEGFPVLSVCIRSVTSRISKILNIWDALQSKITSQHLKRPSNSNMYRNTKCCCGDGLQPHKDTDHHKSA